MKPAAIITSRCESRCVRAGALALVGAGAALAWMGGLPVRAQQFPPTPGNEPTQSMGVFLVKVTDPNLFVLMQQGAFPEAYSGWNNVDHSLTSPLLYDPYTSIAVSGRHLRESATADQTYFPVTVGQNAGALPGSCLNPLTPDVIINHYNDYIAYPDFGGFDSIYAQHMGPAEVLTEIQAFTLSTITECCSNYPSVPPCGQVPYGFAMVRAGYNNCYNIPGGANYLQRSLGMVISQSNPPGASDFPANSFFQIFVEVTLPPIPMTASAGIFPIAGAVLTNDLPLIITNLGITALPPSVAYLHATSTNQPFAVNLNFRDTCPVMNPATSMPYYSGGQTFGQLVLAGHGTGLNACSKGPQLDAFLAAVFGTPGQRNRQALIGRTFANSLFPSPSSFYLQALGTNFDGSSVDAIQFSNGVTTLFLRDLNIGNLVSPAIDLPSPGSSVTYSNPNSVVTFDLSSDGTNFIAASGTGVVQVLVVNNNVVTGSVSNFDTQITALNISGTSGIGAVRLRQSTTKTSPGLHVTKAEFGSYRVGGYFDVSLEYGFNSGLVWKPASRPVTVYQDTLVNCGGAAATIGLQIANGVATASWGNGNYRLQSTTSLSRSNIWTDLPYASPYLFNVQGTTNIFFRLICP